MQALIILGENFASLAYGNNRELPHVLNVSFMQKRNFKKNTFMV